tara:strand:- start:86 stop:361 length:276 start_codon:yes stop_codon:yes gene_type:complete
MSEDKITREVIAIKISEEFGIAYSIAYKKIDSILKIWGTCLTTSNLSISGIGTFKIKEKNSRLGRNPKTKEEFEIESRKVISYKKSSNLRL